MQISIAVFSIIVVSGVFGLIAIIMSEIIPLFWSKRKKYHESISP